SKVGMSQVKSRTKRTIKELSRTCGSQLRSCLRLVYILRPNSEFDLIVDLERFSIEFVPVPAWPTLDIAPRDRVASGRVLCKASVPPCPASFS
ncbi:hypothetical protein J6590_101882, partial [Homalodisca vitripennis]